MQKNAKIIIIGNEKGGTGKTTLTMNLIIAILEKGFNVSSIDIDGRQGTLTKYIKNRTNFAKEHNIKLEIPNHISIAPAPADTITQEVIKQDVESLKAKIEELKTISDVIIIDTPGSDNYLSKPALMMADMLITPLNDSLLDLDVLADIDVKKKQILKPSIYAEKLWDVRKERALINKKPLDWVVLKNRVLHFNSKNKKLMDKLLSELSNRIKFSYIDGLGERTIYKELFLDGLTVQDMKKEGIKLPMTTSHLNARREVRSLINSIIR